MNAKQIRDELREGDSPSLRRRRRLARLAAVGLVDFTAISLYQVGAVRRLPDVPGRLVDSNHVSAAVEAYPFGIPDATAGAALYAATLVLAGARGARRHPAWSLALAGAAVAGAAGAVKYLWDMATKEKRACVYCLLGAAVNFVMVPPAVAEARAAWRR
jgi:uncharacterized membrane protein